MLVDERLSEIVNVFTLAGGVPREEDFLAGE